MTIKSLVRRLCAPVIVFLLTLASTVATVCMSSEHFGQLAWQCKRVSGSSGLKVQAAIVC